ncbi:MAG TPA: DUF1223 domain-containing protein [Paracoccaceae bacterium]|nr:DUF1223 domain-containing protein [Paracoccaceae bacterium]
MRQIVSAACGFLFAVTLAQGAQAQGEPGVVVELYTSQGCSSCPPADDFMAVLADEPGVIALALHVDYWDYLGWADAFAQAQFTDRQKAYARSAGKKMIYTPQMIVGGQDRMVGHKVEDVRAAIARHAGLPRDVRLTVTREGDTIRITATAVPPADRRLRVQLVRYLPEQQVAIERGENAGRIVTYRNIVTSWQGVGEWHAMTPLDMGLPAQGDEPVVVILQEDGPAQIVAAAALR